MVKMKAEQVESIKQSIRNMNSIVAKMYVVKQDMLKYKDVVPEYYRYLIKVYDELIGEFNNLEFTDLPIDVLNNYKYKLWTYE
jgi:K+/H+ antiporter YhaU regulatory subunit KhtT